MAVRLGACARVYPSYDAGRNRSCQASPLASALALALKPTVAALTLERRARALQQRLYTSAARVSNLRHSTNLRLIFYRRGGAAWCARFYGRRINRVRAAALYRFSSACVVGSLMRRGRETQVLYIGTLLCKREMVEVSGRGFFWGWTSLRARFMATWRY